MRKLLFTVLVLPCIAVNAQVYKCPAEAAGARLANAKMHIGERNGSSKLHGDVDQVAGEANIHFSFPEDTPRWLVCQYGGKRIAGTAISGADVIGGRESWIRLDPLIATCDLAIRESKPRGGNESTWTAVATCKGLDLPPPVMLE